LVRYAETRSRPDKPANHVRRACMQACRLAAGNSGCLQDVTSLHALRPSAAVVVAPASRLSDGAKVMVHSAARVA
jgi:hypothetical protein